MGWKAILADTPNKGAFYSKIKSGGKKAIKPATEDFEKFVSSFRKSPSIIVKEEETLEGITIFTGVESSWSTGKTASPEDIFMFVTRGTSVRYATMWDDFSPKTSYRSISSGGGGGHRDPLYIDTREPKDGIEAREIEEAVYEKDKAKIIKNFEKLFEKAAQSANLY